MKNIKFMALFLIIAWVSELVDLITGNILQLDSLGVRPRELWSLTLIPLMPFLHGGLGHLIGNTLTFVFLAPLAMVLNDKFFKEATILIVLLSGLIVWFIGRDAIHIGMSAMIFGYLGYALAMCFLSRNWILIPFGAIILYMQSGMFAGMLPFTTPDNVSWEGHLSGAIAGFVIGLMFCKALVKKKA